MACSVTTSAAGAVTAIRCLRVHLASWLLLCSVLYKVFLTGMNTTMQLIEIFLVRRQVPVDSLSTRPCSVTVRCPWDRVVVGLLVVPIVVMQLPSEIPELTIRSPLLGMPIIMLGCRCLFLVSAWRVRALHLLFLCRFDCLRTSLRTTLF